MAKVKPNRLVGRKRGSEVDKSASFLFEIERFDLSYSFGAGSNFAETAFDEYLALKISAVCLAPQKYAGRMTTFTLLGSRIYERLMMDQGSSYKPTTIGQLTLRGRDCWYLGSLPFHTILHLQSPLSAGKLKYIWLMGEKMTRGSATISRISFDIDIEDADIHLLR